GPANPPATRSNPGVTDSATCISVRRPESRRKMAGTVIGPGLTIESELTGPEEAVVYGTGRGTLTGADAVSVGSGGAVEADSRAASLSVAGEVSGSGTANERVDIQAGGGLIGDVKASRLTIADGASFKGNVDMDVG